MALKTLQPDAVTHFGLEDVFVAGDAQTEKLAWVSGWRKLPHLKREVERLFDYPQQFAEDIFDRIPQALRRRVSGGEANVVQHGRFLITPAENPEADSKSVVPEVLARYVRSGNDVQFLSDRREGKFILSYETSVGWQAITKTILTEVLGAGRDVRIVGLPPVAVGVLKLMCPRLL